MKKKICIAATMLMACAGIYVYCNFQSNKDVNKINTTTTKNKEKEYEKILSYGVKIDENTTDITSSEIYKNSNIRFIHNINKEKMIIGYDVSEVNDKNKKVNVKILNLLTGKSEKQIDINFKNSQYYFIPLNKGFYIIHGNIMGNDNDISYDIYDNELNSVRTIDLSSFQKDIACNEFALSNNGDKIAYIDNKSGNGSSIYICDLDSKNKQKVYEVKNNKYNTLASFDDIEFTDNDKKIAFIGKINVNDDIWPLAFGSVSISGGEFNYKKHDGISNIIQMAKGKTFFLDAGTERGKKTSGQVFLQDNISNKVEEYVLKDSKESESAYISDKGNFIVTCLRGKSQNNEPIYRFRIYDAKSKKMVKEMDTTFTEKDFSRCRIQKVYICEDSNSIYIAYKFDKEIKLYKYKIS